MRQVDAVPERRSALVVDEQERQPLRRVGHGHTQDPGLEQLGLARAGRAADQGVRTVGTQVDGERALRGLLDHGAQVARLGALPGLRGVRAGEDGAALPQRSITASGASASSLPTRVRKETERGRSLSSSTGTPESTIGAIRRAAVLTSWAGTVSVATGVRTTASPTKPTVSPAWSGPSSTNVRQAAGRSGVDGATHSTTTPLLQPRSASCTSRLRSTGASSSMTTKTRGRPAGMAGGVCLTGLAGRRVDRARLGGHGSIA